MHMTEEFTFTPPQDYFQKCNLPVNSDLRDLLKSKEVVANCEKMIRDYQLSYQRVSYVRRVLLIYLFLLKFPVLKI